MENSPQRGLSDQKQMLSEIWGFRYHKKPPVLLDPCSVHKNRDQREKTQSYPTSCFFLLPLLRHPKVFHVLRTAVRFVWVPCLFFLYPWQNFQCLKRVLDSSTIQAEQL